MTSNAQNVEITRVIRRLAALHVEQAACIDRLEALTRGCTTPSSISTTSSRHTEKSKAQARESAVVSRSTMSIGWNGKTCHMGFTIPFRLFEYLFRCRNRFCSHDELINEVWNGSIRDGATIRSEVRHLKDQLTRAGMVSLARCIKTSKQHYGLMF